METEAITVDQLGDRAAVMFRVKSFRAIEQHILTVKPYYPVIKPYT